MTNHSLLSLDFDSQSLEFFHHLFMVMSEPQFLLGHQVQSFVGVVQVGGGGLFKVVNAIGIQDDGMEGDIWLQIDIIDELFFTFGESGEVDQLFFCSFELLLELLNLHQELDLQYLFEGYLLDAFMLHPLRVNLIHLLLLLYPHQQLSITHLQPHILFFQTQHLSPEDLFLGLALGGGQRMSFAIHVQPELRKTLDIFVLGQLPLISPEEQIDGRNIMHQHLWLVLSQFALRHYYLFRKQQKTTLNIILDVL